MSMDSFDYIGENKDREENNMAMIEKSAKSVENLRYTEVSSKGHDTTFSICKALAIILVVLSHSGGPTWLTNFVFQFHVPVFLICTGYFFKTTHLTDEKNYIKRRVTGLYYPFLRWSVFFLLFHNLWFYVGILNEQYGNAAGGVLHPYDFHQFSQRLWSLVFNMSGYDDFLAGSFWFFRALFVGSIAFLLLYKVCVWLLRINRKAITQLRVGIMLLVGSLLLASWLILGNLKITGLSQGGYREIMVVCFMAIGLLFRQGLKFNVIKDIQSQKYGVVLKICFPAMLLLIICSVFLPSSLGYRTNFLGFLTLPFTGFAGFLLLYFFSLWLNSYNNILKKFLVFIGDNTLYVFAFHLLAFKLVSMLKVTVFNLPWEMIGGHPVVTEGASQDFFWILYLLVGVLLPIIWIWAYRKLEIQFGVTLSYSRLLKQSVIQELLRMTYVILYKLILFIWRIISGFFLGIWHFIKNFYQGLKDIISASNPNDE